MKFQSYLEETKTSVIDMNDIKKLKEFKELLRMGFRMVSMDAKNRTYIFDKPSDRGNKIKHQYKISLGGRITALVKNEYIYDEKFRETMRLNSDDPTFGKQVKSSQQLSSLLKYFIQWIKDYYDNQITDLDEE